MPDQIVASEGDTREVVEITEQYGDYAHVEGDTIEGWVELPENPETPNYVVVCDDCGHIETREVHGMKTEVLVDAKHNECNLRSNADLLARTHEAKRPTHSPRVEVVAPNTGRLSSANAEPSHEVRA